MARGREVRAAPAARARREVAARERSGGGAPRALRNADAGAASQARVLLRSRPRRRLRLPPGHARSAEVPAAAGERVLREHVERAAARRGHDRARDAADRCRLLHGQERRHARQRAALSGDAGGSRSRAGALQHLLHAVPRRHRQRQRPGRAARLSEAADVSQRSAAADRGRVLLRRHDERFRQDAGLPCADDAARSLEHRRLHPRAAIEPARGRVGCAGRRPDEAGQAGGHADTNQ